MDTQDFDRDCMSYARTDKTTEWTKLERSSTTFADFEWELFPDIQSWLFPESGEREILLRQREQSVTCFAEIAGAWN
jgi:hypothetical protein